MLQKSALNENEDILVSTVPWLVIFALALLPVGRLAEVPLALLALIGIKVLFQNFSVVARQRSALFFLLFFLCLWLPIIISLPDSYNVGKTSRLALEYLRFLLSGIAVLHYCVTANSFKIIQSSALCIIAIWIVYGMLHLFWGVKIAAISDLPQWVKGVFEKRFALNMVFAVSSSFLVHTIVVKKYRILSLIANLAFVTVLLLGGSRGALIMYGCIVVLFALYHSKNNFKKASLGLALFILCTSIAGVVLHYTSEKFSARIEQTLLVFKGDYKSVDTALSLRLPIWEAALAMIKAHPINGVGGRSFRYAYPEYAEEDDLFLEPDPKKPARTIGAAHSHQMQLEILCETGMLGGVFFLCGLAVLIRYWQTRSIWQRDRMLPYALSSFAIFFPLNTHPALYSSAWAQTIYWFVTLFFAAGSVSDYPIDTDS